MKHPNVISSKINAINEVTNLSLAKYEVINHPLNPLRLTQVVYMLSKIIHLDQVIYLKLIIKLHT